MKIEIEVSNQNEGTEAPYWLILDPSQNFRADVATLAGMINGPFFSREEAESQLTKRRYAYGKNAVVYCLSGYYSVQYRNKMRDLK